MNKWQAKLLSIFLISSIIFMGCSANEKAVITQETDKPKPDQIALPTLSYLDHASVKIKTLNGTVIYIDPAFGEDYSEPADIVFITHYHQDHYKLGLISNNDYKLITPIESLKDGVCQKLEVMGIKVESVPAYNSNHLIEDGVGYILEFDGIKLYHAGDTSTTDEMVNFPSKNITYALLPVDGVANMGPGGAMEVANIIKAKYYIPIHSSVAGMFYPDTVDRFKVDNKIVLKPGNKLHLKK